MTRPPRASAAASSSAAVDLGGVARLEHAVDVQPGIAAPTARRKSSVTQPLFSAPWFT